MSNELKSKKILFQLTGSIAAYKACGVISKLVQAGAEVQVVASENALAFVGEATLEGLTGRPVATKMFASGHAMEHISWARWADLLILCPATANSINRLAAGIADDLIGTIFLSAERSKPYLIAPAMNVEMLKHPSVQRSLETLRSWGAVILETESGRLACGEEGYGKLLNPERIFEEIVCHLSPPTTHPAKRILITSGATREAIDGVRFITNMSTGKTGAMASDLLARRGFAVTLLRGAGSEAASHPRVRQLKFTDFSSLDHQLREELASYEYDVVVQMAAVSDYSLDRIFNEDGRDASIGKGKIDSAQPLQLVLKPNYKIVDRLKNYSRNRNLKVIAFKLTNTRDEQERVAAVERLFSRSKVDAVIHNDLSEVSGEEDGQKHIFHFFRDLKSSETIVGKNEMIDRLGEFI